jgi:signal transduction histidine kinase
MKPRVSQKGSAAGQRKTSRGKTLRPQPKTPRKKPAAFPPRGGTLGAPALIGSADQWEELQKYIQIQDKIIRGLRTFIDEMTVIFRFIETVSEYHAQERIVQLLLDVMKELFKYEAAAVYLEERPDPGDYAGQTLKRSYRPEVVESIRRRLRVDENIYDWVFKQGHAIVLPVEHKSKTGKPQERWSFMLVPLATSSERLGRLELVFNHPEGEFTQQTFSILDVLLKHAALILVNERIYEKERKTAQTYIQLDNLKRDIVNITTHEIKTPLTIINGNAIVLRRDARLNPEEKEKMLDTITRQCQRINTIINQMVETAQLEEGRLILHPEPVGLSELTSEILKDVYFDAANISVQARFGEPLWPVFVDRESLHKVLRNLVENAIKYSPHGGAIRISGENAGENVLWRIADQGEGIAADEQSKIFDKFYRVGASTTRGVRGMGFGLYLVKKSLELNGGSVQVESTLGAGSVFTVTLPKASPGQKV